MGNITTEKKSVGGNEYEVTRERVEGGENVTVKCKSGTGHAFFRDTTPEEDDETARRFYKVVQEHYGGNVRLIF